MYNHSKTLHFVSSMMTLWRCTEARLFFNFFTSKYLYTYSVQKLKNRRTSELFSRPYQGFATTGLFYNRIIDNEPHRDDIFVTIIIETFESRHSSAFFLPLFNLVISLFEPKIKFKIIEPRYPLINSFGS